MRRLFARSSRKAWLFNILMVIFTIVILTYAFIQISAKQNKVTMQIGENSLTLVSRVQEGEKALIFLDFATKLAMYQAIHDLEAGGGVSEESECGSYYGFNKWNSESGDNCFVSSAGARDSLRDLFVSDLVARLAAYPSADFIGNLPTAAYARGAAAASTTGMGVSVAPEGSVQSVEQDQVVQDQRITNEGDVVSPGVSP